MVDRESRSVSAGASAALGAFAEATERLSVTATVEERLTALAEAAATAVHADAVVVRLLDPASRTLVVRAVASSSPAVAAELEGSRVPASAAPTHGDAPSALPEDLRRLAARAGAEAALVVPVRGRDGQIGTVELLRGRRPFDRGERLLAELTAGQVAFVAGAGTNGLPDPAVVAPLEALGEAFAAAADRSRVEAVVARLAARASGALAAVVWDVEDGVTAEPVARFGVPHDLAVAAPAWPAADDAPPVVLEEPTGELPVPASSVATVRLGEPPVALLQLFLAEPPGARVLDSLGGFGVRAGQALRASRRADRTTAELERTRALLAVVGQAIAELSLSHTLETAVARVADLLGAARVAVYLHEHGSLRSAAERGLARGHTDAAEALLRVALGPFRTRGVLVVAHDDGDPRLNEARDAVRAVGAEAAIAVPLAVADEVIGLLVAYLERGRKPTDDETALLAALAAQLGVAVQNARLHEEAKRLGAERARALEAERHAARTLRAFYEVSQSFTRTLELGETLEALARTAVELLDADVAVIRTHDPRRAALVPQAVHAADDRLGQAVEAMLSRSQRLEGPLAEQLVQQRTPLLLTPDTASALGEAYDVLAPFLERGATAAVVPVGSAGELFATLTVVSLDTARPIGEEAIAAAASLAAHAVLAVDNARLYEQQKHFLETMQRSLLPRSLPDVPGLELGYVYESSARLEVGGDVWDFMPLEDGRFAVVLGDVSGHGVEAAADMAMAKFVFRSLAREHPEPPDFLGIANEVIVGDIALGKFITMAYVLLDPSRGELVCASAGHPSPRLVRARAVEELAARGMALGVEPAQRYDAVSERLAPGDAVVLYTDGVVEARSGSEPYGEGRLDAVLAANAGASASKLAEAVLRDCRSFATELIDDCAVVVVKRA